MSEDQEPKKEGVAGSETPQGSNGSGHGSTENLKAELQKAKNDYLYLLAEFDNYRKNAIKERSDLVKYGSERFVREFLGVFDNFERALETDKGTEQNFREGVQMIANEIRALLKNFSVEEVPAAGQAFDPSQHEALSSEPREDVPAGHVAQVFRKAYKMHDRLIRPAQVTVATAPKG
jgi:molecular chaperone GrpE